MDGLAWLGPPLAGLDAFEAGSRLAVALGCGLLVGVERERRQGQSDARTLAGLRTFAVAALAGCAAMLVGGLVPLALGAAFVAALTVKACARQRSDDPGVTTELALWLTFVIGALGVWLPALAAGLAVALTTLLAWRQPMHRFARQWLSEAELRDGL